ncbi:MAG: hypothetical protein QF805_07065, partial [Pirellulaceae bacterium]|nr:hypothetical protein [Pirellulaceae bacterium]
MDPYHIWLGIPANEQPADHYRLLGLTRFEGDERVIEAAADRQMTHVRNMQGKHPGLATQILNELSRVRNCLLSPEAKAEYDRQLSASVAVVGPEPSAVEPLAAAPAPVSEAIPPRVAAPLDSIPSVAPAKPSHRRRKQSINPLIFVGVGLFAVVAVGVLLIAVVWIAADRGADAFAEVGDPPPVSSPLTPSPRPIRINPDLPSVEPKPSPPPAVTPAATPAPAPKRTVEPGLVKATFARQPQQQANKGFVPFENLNDVLDPTSTILSVHKWKFPANRNTAAFGLLKIDEP